MNKEIIDYYRQVGHLATAFSDRVLEQTRLDREKEIREKWPNYADLVEEIRNEEENLHHRQIALDSLKEERDILKKLIGIDNNDV